MSVQDEAAEVIERVMSEYDMDRGPFATEYVEALADAGLLAPEMQEKWGVEIIRGGRPVEIDWCHDRLEAENLIADRDHFPLCDDMRLARRHVTTHEVIAGE